MRVSFQGPAVLVRDINVSRRFYEQALGQEVLADHGVHLVLGGFFLWQADAAAPVMLGPDGKTPTPLGQDNFELYFETEDLDAAWTTAEKHGATALHPMVEQPWGQRGFRLADPDGHVVEVARAPEHAGGPAPGFRPDARRGQRQDAHPPGDGGTIGRKSGLKPKRYRRHQIAVNNLP